MTEFTIILIAVIYMTLLFLVAFLSEKYPTRIANQGMVYALSLMVYCTAWTFYGSVGRASTDGVSFLVIYIGPLMTIPFWGYLLKKMVVVTQTLRISSVADFISIRYGKNARLGTIVAFACLLAVIPYTALQLKAIFNSIAIVTNGQIGNAPLIFVLMLGLFVTLFGARNVDANQRKNGLVSAIAAESLVKLVAFLVLGGFVVYGLFDGFGDVFNQAEQANVIDRFQGISTSSGYMDWFLLSMVSAIAFLILPRQFQVGCVDAGSADHVETAMRTAPVYLLLINLFVIPIAIAGLILLPDADPDFVVLNLPLMTKNTVMTTLVFIGGFSAASSMILVSTTALSTMLSNYVFIPLILRTQKEDAATRQDYQSKLLQWRRVSIWIIILLAYSYYRYMTFSDSLVDIGIVSFIAIAQLAPSFFGGLYWKKATTKAAIAGIIGGLFIWFILLVLPNLLLQIGYLLDLQYVNGTDLTTFLSTKLQLTKPSVAIVLSLGVNMTLYLYHSQASDQTAQELNQAELFVDIFKYAKTYDSSVAWRGTAFFPDIKSLLNQFIGNDRTEAVLDRYARRHGIDWEANPRVDSRVISYAERVLTGVIGPSSARIMVSNVVEEEEIGIKDVLDILQESQEVMKLNKELQLKSNQLERMSANLRDANQKLKSFSDLKDEFLYTVTHELRTPVTAIRSMAELMEDTEDLNDEERLRFLKGITQEAERMSTLISNVLDLEKFESGNQQLERQKMDLAALIQEEVDVVRTLTQKKSIEINLEMNNRLDPVYADRERVRQVLTNLLSNAMKYCDQENGIISVTAYRNAEFIKVNISNNGKGIDQADLSNIFDKFYQVKHQTRKKPEGHGLGLAICKNIIEMHGGEIKVGMRDEMVRFSFLLPVHHQNHRS